MQIRQLKEQENSQSNIRRGNISPRRTHSLLGFFDYSPRCLVEEAEGPRSVLAGPRALLLG